TGAMSIGHGPADGSSLAGVTTVFDSNQVPIASDDPQYTWWVPGLSNFRVTYGQSYYVRVSSGDGVSTGGYLLSFTTPPDDFGNDFTTAYVLTLANGPLIQPGRVDYSGDVDMFRFVAPTTGIVTIGHTPAEGSSLATVVTVFDVDR